MSPGERSGRRLRILITNRTLATRTGTELYVRDLAVALARRGHAPIVYAPRLGDVAREIRAETIPVTDDLRTVAEPPDLVHGHHGIETLTALLAFPAVPGIAVCHSWVGWADAPLVFPRVLRHVAVDDTCRDRLRFEHGIPDARLHVVLNAVDLARFRPRPALPPRPRRALVFSNAARPGGAQVPAIEAACAAHGIAVDLLGVAADRSTADPETLLPRYDLVFAKAKAALEAISVGTAVVLCDAVGAGPMVATANLAELRRVNFGMRALRHPCTPAFLAEQIARYDAADAQAVSAAVRASAGTDSMVDELCALYEEVLGEHAATHVADPAADARAAATYLQGLAPRLRERDLLVGALENVLRRPVLGRMIRRAASASGRAWITELLQTRGTGGT